jgi:hypothetical protein
LRRSDEEDGLACLGREHAPPVRTEDDAIARWPSDLERTQVAAGRPSGFVQRRPPATMPRAPAIHEPDTVARTVELPCSATDQHGDDSDEQSCRSDDDRSRDKSSAVVIDVGHEPAQA